MRRVGTVVGKHEMIHPANTGGAIVDACGHARTEHRHEHHVLAGHIELVRQQLHAGTLEMIVEVQVRCDRQATHASSPARTLPAFALPAGVFVSRDNEYTVWPRSLNACDT